MRLIFWIFILFTYNFAQELNFGSIKSDFVQTVTSPESSSIVYEGQFYAKKPSLALWSYTRPTKKSIYISHQDVLIVEPELEQVILSKLDTSPNISAILKSAKKVSKNIYKTTYEETLYTIVLKDNLPHTITYKDRLDNQVTITFSHTSTNIFLDDTLFTFSIPKSYDIIQN